MADNNVVYISDYLPARVMSPIMTEKLTNIPDTTPSSSEKDKREDMPVTSQDLKTLQEKIGSLSLAAANILKGLNDIREHVRSGSNEMAEVARQITCEVDNMNARIQKVYESTDAFVGKMGIPYGAKPAEKMGDAFWLRLVEFGGGLGLLLIGILKNSVFLSSAGLCSIFFGFLIQSKPDRENQ